MRRASKFAALIGSAAMITTMGLTAMPANADAWATCNVGVETISVCFPDDVLAHDVARAAGVSADAVFTPEMAGSITSLVTGSILDGRVTSFLGVHNLRALTSLTVGSTSVSNLDDLVGAPLQSLRIDEAPNLTDIDAVRDIDTLKSLSLSKTPLTSTAAIHDMPNLEKIDFYQTPLRDVPAYRGLPRLWSFNLSWADTTVDVNVPEGGTFSVDVPTFLGGRRARVLGPIYGGGTWDEKTNKVTWTQGLEGDEFGYAFSFHLDDVKPAQGVISGQIKVKVHVTDNGGSNGGNSNNGGNGGNGGNNGGATTPENGVPVYRLSGHGVHHYTTSVEERDALTHSGQWTNEGVAFYQPASGKPVYRACYQPTGKHLWTSDIREYGVLTNRGWNGEGVAWYTDDTGTKPVYRLYDTRNGEHMFTSDKREYDALSRPGSGWNGEGVAWYSL